MIRQALIITTGTFLLSLPVLCENPPVDQWANAQYLKIIQEINNKNIRKAVDEFKVLRERPSDPAVDHVGELCEKIWALYSDKTKNEELDSDRTSWMLRGCVMDPSPPSVLWERGMTLFNRKEYSAAAKYFHALNTRYSDDANAPKFRALEMISFVRSNQCKAAQDAFEKSRGLPIEDQSSVAQALASCPK